MPTEELALRPATPDDASLLTLVHLAARRAAPMPAPVHTDAEVRAWVTGWLETDDAWVAEHEGRPVGYLRLTPGWLDDLYVHPEHAGQGVGSTLLDLAKHRQPAGFSLWVFESNLPARTFYSRRGLLSLERTDGSGNEEQEPDVRMAWPGSDPLRYLRGLIDDVDDQLGDLLGRRVALTRAAQAHKPDRSRDAEREQEIVRRLAARLPELGESRVQPIVHAIITQSLAAVEET